MTQTHTILPFEAALDGLCGKDNDFALARAKWGNPPDRFMPQNYASLARIILGQQISRAVATTLWARLEARDWVDAAALANLEYVDLQQIRAQKSKRNWCLIVVLGPGQRIIIGCLRWGIWMPGLAMIWPYKKG